MQMSSGSGRRASHPFVSRRLSMRQDRFLMGILIGIGVLIVAALVVFFTRQNQASYVAENTPDGVVHNYVLAILNKDYQKAYGYLADLDHKPTFAEFRQAFAVGRLTPTYNLWDYSWYQPGPKVP